MVISSNGWLAALPTNIRLERQILTVANTLDYYTAKILLEKQYTTCPTGIIFFYYWNCCCITISQSVFHCQTLHSSLILAGKVATYQSEAPYGNQLKWLGRSLTHKYQTREEVTDCGKYSRLLYSKNTLIKNAYYRPQIYKTFLCLKLLLYRHKLECFHCQSLALQSNTCRLDGSLQEWSPLV